MLRPADEADCDEGTIQCPVNSSDVLERATTTLAISTCVILRARISSFCKNSTIRKEIWAIVWVGAAAGPSGGNRGWYVHSELSQEACKQTNLITAGAASAATWTTK